MTLSEITYLPIRPNEKGLIGFASLLYDNSIAFNSIAVYSTPSGSIRLVFPITTLSNGKTLNTYYPINKKTYDLILEAIKAKIYQVINNLSE